MTGLKPALPTSAQLAPSARWAWIGSIVSAYLATFVLLTSVTAGAFVSWVLIGCLVVLVLYPRLAGRPAPRSGYWSLGGGAVVAAAAGLWSDALPFGPLGSLDTSTSLLVVVGLWVTSYVLLRLARRLSGEKTWLQRFLGEVDNDKDDHQP